MGEFLLPSSAFSATSARKLNQHQPAHKLNLNRAEGAENAEGELN